jgi:ABC-type branched-subunit amino acid transport system substrate-binding protein
MKSRLFLFRLLSAGLAVTLVACSGNGGSSSTKKTLVVAAFNPFTGADADFGPEMLAGCWPGVQLVNQSGGVLGNQLTCSSVDTRGDPADAVPAASKLLATTSNLIGILGPSSDEADATVPIFDQAKIPMFADTGEASFDKSTYDYFWRLTPADDVKGYAMALWAHQQGWKRGALVFGNDISSQSNVPTLEKAITGLGDTVAINLKVTLDQSSYRTEVERLAQANPQVIYTEGSPQTDAALLSELQQLHGLIPFIGTDATLQPAWLKAVSGAIGEADMKTYYVGEQPYAPPSGPSWSVFNKALLASSNKVSDPSSWSTDVYTMTDYDAVIITALAATAAKSTDPAVFNAFIPKVTDAGSGKVVVHSYAEGLKALKAGDQIQYLGAGGDIAFDQSHNSAGGFEFASYSGNGHVALQGSVTADQIAALIQQ